MILKCLIGFLVFDGILAVLLGLLLASDAKAADRKVEAMFRRNRVNDHSTDDVGIAGDGLIIPAHADR